MPIYEYRCEECGEIYERLRRMQDADSNLRCPRCGSETVERLVSVIAARGCRGCAGSGPG